MSIIHAMTGALMAAVITACIGTPGVVIGLVVALVYYGHVKLR